MAEEPYISAREAASRLGVRLPTLYAYVSRGLVRSDGTEGDPRRRRYRLADIERLIERKGGRRPERVAGATLDWGLPVLESRITLIDDGRLHYRGRDAVRLAETATLEETARLLWGCGDTDPFAAPLPALPATWGPLTRALAGTSPLERCLAVLPAIDASGLAMGRRDERRLWPAAATLLRSLAAAAAGVTPAAAPIHEQLAAAGGLDAHGAALLRRALVLLADHELNASTFAVRVVASTGASLGAAVAGGLAALSGPRHGAATAQVEALFDEVERRGDAARVVAERLQRGEYLPGFGHPLYREGDPRGRALIEALPSGGLLAEIAAAVDALGGWRPNVDFALVALRRALALPRGAALALFAIGRSAGWIAHALEQQQGGRLIRPRARYVGERPAAEIGAMTTLA